MLPSVLRGHRGHRGHRAHLSRGQSVVEFALILPVFMLFFATTLAWNMSLCHSSLV